LTCLTESNESYRSRTTDRQAEKSCVDFLQHFYFGVYDISFSRLLNGLTGHINVTFVCQPKDRLTLAALADLARRFGDRQVKFV
jgi:hypothetical protein